MKQPIIIVGAGGHGVVVADALLAAGEQVIGFTDADAKRIGDCIFGLPVIGGDDSLAEYSPSSVLLVNGIGGVGDTSLRRLTQQHLESKGWRFTSVRHPSAIVSPFSSLTDDIQLLAASIVQAGAQISKGCIVNTGAVIEHDVRLGDWTHIAPRALLCGGAMVGECCFVGAGAILRQGIRLGDKSIVGAGAVVVADFVEARVLVGIPARPMERRR